MADGLRLNLGAGAIEIDGFTPVDRKTGGEVYPLAQADNSVDEIRASHILEHFSHRDTVTVLKDWARALKPGAWIKVAVPDYDALHKIYEAGSDGNTEAYLFGGHLDKNDIHLAMFNFDKLEAAMRDAGFVDIARWDDDVVDCAKHPFSLNLTGRTLREGEAPHPAPLEPLQDAPKIAAIMSVPRLGFMTNFTCCFHALMANRITMKTIMGAYWGQCLQRAMDMVIDEGYDTILTLDYDTVFTAQDLQRLIQAYTDNPHVDALAAVQIHRALASPLMTAVDQNGELVREVAFDAFTKSDVLKIRTAHFGLTLLRVDALKRMPKPWFVGVPDKDGGWGEGRKDDDINFWLKWAEAGNGLYLANRVAIGHAELTIRWPGRNLRPVFQSVDEFQTEGPPEEIWQ